MTTSTQARTHTHTHTHTHSLHGWNISHCVGSRAAGFRVGCRVMVHPHNTRIRQQHSGPVLLPLFLCLVTGCFSWKVTYCSNSRRQFREMCGDWSFRMTWQKLNVNPSATWQHYDVIKATRRTCMKSLIRSLPVRSATSSSRKAEEKVLNNVWSPPI